MDKRIAKRVSAVVDGQDGAVSRLAEALEGVEPAVLLDLGAHRSAGVRQAVAIGLWGRAEPELAELIVELAADRAPGVRISLAQGLSNVSDWPLPAAVLAKQLADPEAEVRFHAVTIADRHAELHQSVRHMVREDGSWKVRETAATTLGRTDPRDCLAVLLESVAKDADEDVRAAASAALDGHLETLGGFPADVERPPIGLLGSAHEQLQEESRFPRLCGWLADVVQREADPAKLARFGTDLSRLALAGELPRGHNNGPGVETMLEVLEGQGSRAMAVLGPSGCGKTALVHELVHRLARRADGPWCVLRVAPADLMAGTVYVGEWQTKVRDLVEASRAPKKVLLYVPNLQELSAAGRSSRNDMNIATMLAPYIESGAVALVGEATREAYQRGLGSHPELRRLFTQIQVQPATREMTRELLSLVAEEQGAAGDDAFFDKLMDLADYYVQGTAQPGRAVGLLRRILETRPGEELVPTDVLEVLHESTGIPTRFLDDTEALDLEEVRTFLEARVMGQPEAVDSVLDLVTLVKAGLTDDSKPAGVLLFVGPTGVGKTELARALAELLFGDPARLLRFDMSEFASYESYERLIGKHGRSGLLTDAVREHPFSVVLLDEIEKSHANVFDLCLGVFDAGRLTDGAGRTVDFRRAIIILTSNIGAAVPLDPLVGFGATRPPPPDKASIDRDLRRSFRPEFLNRLDRIVSFRPLGAETAERIARRELARVLVRGGIARRGLTIDVDPAVFSLLMRMGYSPAFGARPLKRTVERHVVLPVARAIAGGHATPGAVLRLVVQGDAVAVETVAADESDAVLADEVAPTLLAVQGRVAALLEAIAPLEQQKGELLERSNAPGFWDDRRAAVVDLDAIHRLDRVIQDVRQLGRQVEITAANKNAERQRHFLQRHEGELGRLELVLGGADLGDAYVTLSRVKHEHGGLDGVARLARMYQLFARRQGFEVSVLDDREGDEPHEDTITLGIYGPGALAVFGGEAGLHKLARDPSNASPRRQRDLVRVDVLAVPGDGTPLPPNEVAIETRPLKARRGRLLETLRTEVHLRHALSMVSVTAWIERPVEEALGALHSLLRARQQALGQQAGGTPPVVRRYVLGPSPLVSDRRSGRSTGNLDRVLRGELEGFCAGGAG